MIKEIKIKIESGIPLPARRENAGKWKDVFRTMKKDDSFKIDEDAIPTLRSVLRYHAGKYGQFTIRKAKTGEYRCWKVK